MGKTRNLIFYSLNVNTSKIYIVCTQVQLKSELYDVNVWSDCLFLWLHVLTTVFKNNVRLLSDEILEIR